MNKSFYLTPILLGVLLFLPAPDAAHARAPLAVDPCATASASDDPTATLCISQDVISADGTSANNRFAVSWISATPQNAQVKLAGGATFDDVRGAGFVGTTHYFQIGNLASKTSYQFELVSNGTRYTSGNWTINVGPALQPAAPDTIIGRVKNSDGSDATEALVYVAIQHGSNTSSLLSQVMTVDDAGFFHVSLSDARTSDFSARFSYSSSGDSVTITAVGPSGRATAVVDTSAPRPGKPTLTLTLGSGSGTVSTATPSPVPPTATATTAPPTASHTPLPATATVIAQTQTATASAATRTATALARTATPSNTALPSATTVTTGTAPTSVRPTVARTLFVEPTIPPSGTVAPADQTLVAQATSAATEEPTATRVIRRATATPAPTGGGIGAPESLFIVLAVVAFIGAAILGIAAYFVWRK